MYTTYLLIFIFILYVLCTSTHVQVPPVLRRSEDNVRESVGLGMEFKTSAFNR